MALKLPRRSCNGEIASRSEEPWSPERGYALVLVDALAPEMARTSSQIEQLGCPCFAYEADVALYGRARKVVNDVIRQWQHIDVLIKGAAEGHHRGGVSISRAASTGSSRSCRICSRHGTAASSRCRRSTAAPVSRPQFANLPMPPARPASLA